MPDTFNTNPQRFSAPERRRIIKPVSLFLAFAVIGTAIAGPASAGDPRALLRERVSPFGAHGGDRREFLQKRGNLLQGRGNSYRNHYHDDRRGDAVAAGVVGLAAGAIIGGAAARAAEAQPVYVVPAYGPPPAWSAEWYSYCSSRFRSFDPRSGTYMGYDGLRHFCR